METDLDKKLSEFGKFCEDACKLPKKERKEIADAIRAAISKTHKSFFGEK